MSQFRFGKHPPKTDYRTLRFRDYVLPGLPPPPATYNVLTSVVYEKLHTSDPTELFPMDGNDSLGDCTIAAVAHAATTYRGMVSRKKIMTSQAVVKLYYHLTGGVDSGLPMLDVLNYWHQQKISGDEILAFVSIDPKNHAHVQQAIALFGGVYVGFQVQANCVEEFQAGEPWTPGSLTTDGHAVFAAGYDQEAITVLTWGNVQQGTWAWWDECVDEAYAILPPEAKKPEFAPGFDVTQLQENLNAVAN